MTAVAKTGVYYGYAQVVPPDDKAEEFEKEELVVLPMVMSMGYNPFYDNNKLTAVREMSLWMPIDTYQSTGDSHNASVQKGFL